MYYNGEWGTVWDYYWDIWDSQVVCSELGFDRVADAKYSAYYGQGSGPIWLISVQCDGIESTIRDCYHWDWGRHNCSHNKDFGVKCYVGKLFEFT